MNIESLSSVCTRSRRRRLLACTGVGVLLGALASCHYGSNYNLPTIDVPNAIAIADVDGDGTPDLLLATTADQGNAHNPGFANVILGNHGLSPGAFHTGVTYPTTGNDPSSIAVADLTRSGSLDLVAANFGAGSVSVFMHGSESGYLPDSRKRDDRRAAEPGADRRHQWRRQARSGPRGRESPWQRHRPAPGPS